MAHYFTSALNYSMANEDSLLEHQILPLYSPHVLSICGSGSRVLPLLARFPQKLSIVDVSQNQLYLCEMRIESLRAFSHSDFLKFWGYEEESRRVRREQFKSLNLSEIAKTTLKDFFEEIQWAPPLYQGKWEKTFIHLSRVNRFLTREKGQRLFEAKTHLDHLAYYKKHFPHNAWSSLVFFLGTATIFNALLYKGHCPKPNCSKSMFHFYLQAFQRLFEQGPARENFFLQLLFLGKVKYSEGYPAEAQEEIFKNAKKALEKTEISYLCGDALEKISEVSPSLDFLSFSDVPSYFSGETEKNFLIRIKKHLSPQALVVLRYYRRKPEYDWDKDYENVTSSYLNQILSEKVGVYDVEVLKLRG